MPSRRHEPRPQAQSPDAKPAVDPAELPTEKNARVLDIGSTQSREQATAITRQRAEIRQKGQSLAQRLGMEWSAGLTSESMNAALEEKLEGETSPLHKESMRVTLKGVIEELQRLQHEYENLETPTELMHVDELPLELETDTVVSRTEDPEIEQPTELDTVPEAVLVEEEEQPPLTRAEQLESLGLPENASAEQVVTATQEVADNRAAMTGEDPTEVAAKMNAQARDILAGEFQIPNGDTPNNQEPERSRIDGMVEAVINDVAEDAQPYEDFRKQTETLRREIDGLKEHLAELRKKEPLLSAAFRRLKSFVRSEKAPRPNGEVPTAAELRETEASIAEVEAILKEQQDSLQLMEERAEELAGILVKDSSRRLIETRPGADQNMESTVEDVQLLSAEALKERKQETLAAFYEATGSEPPSDRLRPLVESLGLLTQEELDAYLPTQEISVREMNARKLAALGTVEESYRQNAEFHKDYVDGQMDLLDAALQAKGLSPDDPTMRSAREAARAAYQEESVQRIVAKKDGELRERIEDIELVRKAELRLRILKQLGIEHTDSLGITSPKDIETGRNAVLLQASYGDERERTAKALDNNIKLLLRLENEIAEIQMRRNPGDQEYARAFSQSIVEGETLRKQIKDATDQREARYELDTQLVQLGKKTIEAIRGDGQSSMREIADPAAWAERMENSAVQNDMSALNDELRGIGILPEALGAEDRFSSVINFDTNPLLSNDPQVREKTMERLIRLVNMRNGELIPLNTAGEPDVRGEERENGLVVTQEMVTTINDRIASLKEHIALSGNESMGNASVENSTDEQPATEQNEWRALMVDREIREHMHELDQTLEGLGIEQRPEYDDPVQNLIAMDPAVRASAQETIERMVSVRQGEKVWRENATGGRELVREISSNDVQQVKEQLQELNATIERLTSSQRQAA